MSEYDVTGKLELWFETDFSFAAFKTIEDDWLTCVFQMNDIDVVRKI